MSQNLTNIDALLKDFYLDKIPEQVKQNFPLSEWAEERDDMPTDGRQVLYPLHIGRNVGVGAIAENANLPTAGNQQFVDVKVPYMYNYARITLTSQAISASKNAKGAFEKGIHAEIMGASRDCGRNRNRQLFGAGTGIIGLVNGAVNAAKVVTVKNGYNQTGTAAQYNPCRFFAANQILGFIKTDGTFEVAGTVASVQLAAKTVTLSANASITDGDFIVFLSTAASTVVGDSGYNNEIMGLLGLIDDGTNVGTLANVNRTTYPIFNSSVVDLGNGALSEALMQQLWDSVDQQSDGKLTVGFWHHSTRSEYLNLLQSFKRFANEGTLLPDGGWKGGLRSEAITFNEVPLEADRDCPYGTLFVLDESVFYRYVEEEGKFADLDGRILLRLSSQDAYEARFRIYDNFMYDAPNRAGVMRNIGLSVAPSNIQLI